MICPADISNIKAELRKNIGQKVMIRGAKGRRKVFEEKAVIENIYPSIFNVKNEGKDTKSSYKYEDVLTNELQISIFNGTDYYPLVPTVLKEKF